MSRDPAYREGTLVKANQKYFQPPVKMTRKMAMNLAKETYGPTATAVGVSNVAARGERFCVSMTEPGGVDRAPMLVVLGYGDSYESAFKMAETNPNAIMAKTRIENIRKDYESGKFSSPEEYVREVLMKQLKESIDGNQEASVGPDGASDEGTGVQGVEERPVIL
jgi:hypothetical protein